MQATQIQIAYVNLPKTETGPGSIKDSNGVYWTLWKDQLPNFIGKEGQIVTINYETKMYRGKAQHTILGLAGAAVGMPPAVPRQSPPVPAAFDVGTAYAAVSGAKPAGFVNPVERDENIAVLALVKGWMDRVPVGDIAGLTHALRTCRAAWREFRRSHAAQTSAPTPRSPLREELNDEVPNFEPGQSIDETF